MTSGPTDSDSRALRVVASTLGCPEAGLSRAAKINETQGWDSLTHVQLMLALEKEFGVRLDAEAIMRFTSLDRIIDHFRKGPSGRTAGPTVSPAESAAGVPAAELDLDGLTGSLRAALPGLGIEPGDLLLVHSFLGMLLPACGSPDTVCERIIGVLRHTLGPRGTLVLPTFARAFTRKGTFDRANTPSEMGLLTEFFRKLPGVRHMLHPYHRFSALGARADELAACDCRSSFGPGSPLHVMHRLGGKVLLFSVDWEVCTFFHYVEEQFEVPYRFYKDISGTVVGDEGPLEETWLEYAGNLGRGCEDSFNAFGRRVESAGLCRSARVGPVRLKSFRMDKVFEFTYAALEQNTDCLITT